MDENPEDLYQEKWTDQDAEEMTVTNANKSPFIKHKSEVQEAEEGVGSSNVGIDLPKYLQKFKTIF